MKAAHRKPTTLQLAFSSKNNLPGSNNANMEDFRNNSAITSPEKRRHLVAEAPVTFCVGLQVQERHLFLFNDLLLVAKPRSGGNFKLKERVRLSEMWMSRCVDQVCEVAKSPEASFVIGWPTVNVVVTFSSLEARDHWWNQLGHVIKEECRKEQRRSTNVQVTYNDTTTNIEYRKTLSVTPIDTAKDCIRMALSHLELSQADADSFRLWVKTSDDDAPYPLIGHEIPYSIKDHYDKLRNGDKNPAVDYCNNLHNKCQFILKKVRSAELNPEAKTKSAKVKRSPGKIQKVFRRVQSKSDIDVVDASSASQPSGALFGQQLFAICPAQQLPMPLMQMLIELRKNGPNTVGIFRKSANAKQVRELRQQLDASANVDWSEINPIVIAAVLKEFLRSLPDCLLLSALYPRWLKAVDPENLPATLVKIKTLCGELPLVNLQLLRFFLCLLVHIAANSEQNMMSPINLAVCVGPSLLWTNQNRSTEALDLNAEALASKQIPALVTLFVEQCSELFGPDTLHLLDVHAGHYEKKKTERKNSPVQKKMAKHGTVHQNDSGIEESDSLHGSHHYDNSSMDSLEQDSFNPSLETRFRNNEISTSRDSGLTLSDSHLYMPDEEEEEESESASSGRGSDKIIKRPIPTLEKITPAPHWLSKTTPTNYAASRITPSNFSANRIFPSNYQVHKATPTIILQEEFPAVYPSVNAGVRRNRSQHVSRRNGLGSGSADPRMRRSASEESLGIDVALPRSLARARQQRIAKSQPAIDEVDGNTLSDNDSTPRVSRSSSRGTEYATTASRYAYATPQKPSVHIRITEDGRNTSIVYPKTSEANRSLKKRKERSHWSKNQRPGQSDSQEYAWNTWGGSPKQIIHWKNDPNACVRAKPRPVRIHMDASILRDAYRDTRRNVSVVNITDNYVPLHRSFAFSTDTLKHTLQRAEEDYVDNWNRRSATRYCEAATQTSFQDSFCRNPERNLQSASHRSRSVPPKEKLPAEGSEPEVQEVTPRSQRISPPSYRHPPNIPRFATSPRRIPRRDSSDSFETESYV